MLRLPKYQILFSLEVRELGKARRDLSNGNPIFIEWQRDHARQFDCNGTVPKSAAAARGMCIPALGLGEESAISMAVAD